MDLKLFVLIIVTLDLGQEIFSYKLPTSAKIDTGDSFLAGMLKNNSPRNRLDFISKCNFCKRQNKCKLQVPCPICNDICDTANVYYPKMKKPSESVAISQRISENSKPLEIEGRYYTVGAFKDGPVQNLLQRLLNLNVKGQADHMIVMIKPKSTQSNPAKNPVIIDTAHVFTKNEGDAKQLNVELHKVGNVEEGTEELVEKLDRKIEDVVDQKRKANMDTHLMPEEIDEIIEKTIEEEKRPVLSTRIMDDDEPFPTDEQVMKNNEENVAAVPIVQPPSTYGDIDETPDKNKHVEQTLGKSLSKSKEDAMNENVIHEQRQPEIENNEHLSSSMISPDHKNIMSKIAEVIDDTTLSAKETNDKIKEMVQQVFPGSLKNVKNTHSGKSMRKGNDNVKVSPDDKNLMSKIIEDTEKSTSKIIEDATLSAKETNDKIKEMVQQVFPDSLKNSEKSMHKAVEDATLSKQQEKDNIQISPDDKNLMSKIIEDTEKSTNKIIEDATLSAKETNDNIKEIVQQVLPDSLKNSEKSMHKAMEDAILSKQRAKDNVKISPDDKNIMSNIAEDTKSKVIADATLSAQETNNKIKELVQQVLSDGSKNTNSEKPMSKLMEDATLSAQQTEDKAKDMVESMISPKEIEKNEHVSSSIQISPDDKNIMSDIAKDIETSASKDTEDTTLSAKETNDKRKKMVQQVLSDSLKNIKNISSEKNMNKLMEEATLLSQQAKDNVNNIIEEEIAQKGIDKNERVSSSSMISPGHKNVMSNLAEDIERSASKIITGAKDTNDKLKETVQQIFPDNLNNVNSEKTISKSMEDATLSTSQITDGATPKINDQDDTTSSTKQIDSKISDIVQQIFPEAFENHATNDKQPQTNDKINDMVQQMIPDNLNHLEGTNNVALSINQTTDDVSDFVLQKDPKYFKNFETSSASETSGSKLVEEMDDTVQQEEVVKVKEATNKMSDLVQEIVPDVMKNFETSSQNIDSNKLKQDPTLSAQQINVNVNDLLQQVVPETLTNLEASSQRFGSNEMVQQVIPEGLRNTEEIRLSNNQKFRTNLTPEEQEMLAQKMNEPMMRMPHHSKDIYKKHPRIENFHSGGIYHTKKIPPKRPHYESKHRDAEEIENQPEFIGVNQEYADTTPFIDRNLLNMDSIMNNVQRTQDIQLLNPRDGINTENSMNMKMDSQNSEAVGCKKKEKTEYLKVDPFKPYDSIYRSSETHLPTLEDLINPIKTPHHKPLDLPIKKIENLPKIHYPDLPRYRAEDGGSSAEIDEEGVGGKTLMLHPMVESRHIARNENNPFQSLGKFIPRGHMIRRRDTREQVKHKNMYFVGDGIKLPLTLKEFTDGSLHLSIDVKALCNCKHCNGKRHHNADQIVGEVQNLEEEVADVPLKVYEDDKPAMEVATSILDDIGKRISEKPNADDGKSGIVKRSIWNNKIEKIDESTLSAEKFNFLKGFFGFVKNLVSNEIDIK